MTYKGEKPVAYLDIPIDVVDFETIDLFNWQEEVKNMISQLEFVRMVDVQSETVERYIREEKIKADLAVPISENRVFNYFREETVKMYAKEFKWDLITASNIAQKFMDFVKQMDMSFSYKPVLLKAIFDYIDDEGNVRICDIVDYFKEFYETRKENGLISEKATSIFQKGGYTDKDVERNILSNPFKRFADMRFLQRCRDVTMIRINPTIFKKLTPEDKALILDTCEKNLRSIIRGFVNKRIYNIKS